MTVSRLPDPNQTPHRAKRFIATAAEHEAWRCSITWGSASSRIKSLNAPAKPVWQRCYVQRAVLRKHKGSRTRCKAVHRPGRRHVRIGAQCNNWRHELSADLANQRPVIAMKML
jgi:hypothetical protein